MKNWYQTWLVSWVLDGRVEPAFSSKHMIQRTLDLKCLTIFWQLYYVINASLIYITPSFLNVYHHCFKVYLI